MALRGLDPLRTLRVLLKQSQFQLIVCTFEGSAAGPAIFRRLGLLRRPVVLWDFSAGTSWRLKKLLQQIVLPNVDGVWCLNKCQIEIAEKQFGASGKTSFTGYDVDSEFFDAKLSQDGDYVLAVGNDVSRDYSTLIGAVHELKIPLKICSRLNLVAPNGIEANVEVIREFVPYTELRNLYALAKFVVLPLKDMTHPGGITTLVEAMSMGKPIICSDSAGIRDVIEPGQNCVVVPPGNRAELRAAILRLDSDVDERARLSRNARSYAEKVLSTPIAAERLSRALDRFI